MTAASEPRVPGGTQGYADYEARRKDRFDKAIQSELAVGFSDDARYA